MKTSLAQDAKILEIPRRIEGTRVGRIVNIDENGRIFINYDNNPAGPVAARFMRSLDIELLREAEKNQLEILLAFENNDPRRPIVIDLISDFIENIADVESAPMEIEKPDEVLLDGKRMVFNAREEIVLRCGKASITLTKAGKVLLRGAYLLNRSSGVNKIKGGSVQIN